MCRKSDCAGSPYDARRLAPDFRGRQGCSTHRAVFFHTALPRLRLWRPRPRPRPRPPFITVSRSTAVACTNIDNGRIFYPDEGEGRETALLTHGAGPATHTTGPCNSPRRRRAPGHRRGPARHGRSSQARDSHYPTDHAADLTGERQHRCPSPQYRLRQHWFLLRHGQGAAPRGNRAVGNKGAAELAPSTVSVGNTWNQSLSRRVGSSAFSNTRP